MSEWAYFIGGPFDLTKKLKFSEHDRYIRMAMAPPLPANPWPADPEILARPTVVTTVTYRLMTKIPQGNDDVAWIYVYMTPPEG